MDRRKKKKECVPFCIASHEFEEDRLHYLLAFQEESSVARYSHDKHEPNMYRSVCVARSITVTNGMKNMYEKAAASTKVEL